MANVLYLGETSSNSTSSHRINALKRLGHEVIVLNPKDLYKDQLQSRVLGKIHYYTGYRFLQAGIKRWLAGVLPDITPDCIWVNSGELLGPKCLELLKMKNVPVILYNNDDPTGNRDGNRFASLLKAIRYYDLCVVRREPNVEEYRQLGARNVKFVWMSYDEVAHKPFDNIAEIPEKFRSEIAFIGTWIPGEKRDEFLLELVNEGLSVSIFGDHWQKSPLFSQLKKYYRGPAIYNRDYVAGVQGAKICLGFLSKGNRDLHTRRSVEIPFIGSVFCAERTTEHLTMFNEGEEAVFWSNAKECAALCETLLKDETRREHIREAGMKKARLSGWGNEEMCKSVLEAVLGK